MATKTHIQWADATWNIARGCTKVDADCKYCYMYRDSYDAARYDPLQVVRTKTVFNMPLYYKQKKSEVWGGRPLIFTSSLTDFFHEAIDGYRHEAWDIIRRCPHLIFLILTKRPERIKDHLPPDWGKGWDNVWLGTSCGSQEAADNRIPKLLDVPAKIKFLSLEPLWCELSLVDLTIYTSQFPFPLGAGLNCLSRDDENHYYNNVPHPIDWVIVGGESGNDTGKYQYRPCKIAWIERIVADCRIADVPVFVKQLGTHLSKELNITRDGGIIEEFPKSLQVRQFPGEFE